MTAALDEVMELTKPLEETNEPLPVLEAKEGSSIKSLFGVKDDPMDQPDIVCGGSYGQIITDLSGELGATSTVEYIAENVANVPGLTEQIEQIVESTTPKFELSEEQQEAKALILKWLEDPKQEFRLGGYAGTGKTTLIKNIMSDLRTKVSVGVAAFTGKAVAVLRRKGVHRACTLHSLLYVAEFNPMTKKIEWKRKNVLPYDMVIVDEASMVSTSLYEDLKRHAIKILFVGDPAQLEPVGDNPNLMRECDYVLRNIHRQAKKSPILRLARAVREGMSDIPEGEWGDDEVGRLKVTSSIYGINLADYDVVVCAKNLTRHSINAKRRAQLDRFDGPVEGESVICLANDRNTGVFNGMMLSIKQIVAEKTFAPNQPGFIADLVDDVEDEYFEVPILSAAFGKDYKRDTLGQRPKAIPFDYGYCLTAHKSQGSEWDRVLVFDEKLWNTDQSRWRYTAITRAAKELTVVLTS